ncbi:cupin domain-containing protein [Halopelagius fulvigenes]|uniref:Cupin domain-containing protein n=1 Tax=Halopelagius fulvigenes TaxID=1198324 RepID=A0ABD5TUI8_9EURY
MSRTTADDEPDGEARAVIDCPPSGKRVRYLEGAAETGGAYARFEMWLAPPPNSHGPMRHVHPEQDEVLAVVAGTLGVWHEGGTKRLGPGESVTVPRGEKHRFWNAGTDELHIVGEVRPALRTEEFMAVTYGLARDGASTPSGMPVNPLRLAAVVDDYDDLLYLAALPVRLQKLGVSLLAPLGRALGYGDYERYLGADESKAE